MTAGGEEPRGPQPEKVVGKGGFFTVHKPAQGKPTRLATTFAALLLLGLILHFFWKEIPAWFMTEPAVREKWLVVWHGVVIGLGVALGAVAWRLINKPAHAEFLIATDTEMKKVNWTSRKELWGSTKVVITFMFMIATLLFVMDLVFHWFFWLIKVLKFAPFGIGG